MGLNINNLKFMKLIFIIIIICSSLSLSGCSSIKNNIQSKIIKNLIVEGDIKFVDASGAAGVTFEGVTSLNYTGDLGGIDGANAKCDSDYSGSHICTDEEITVSGETSFAWTSWIFSKKNITNHKENCFSYTSDQHYWVYEKERLLTDVGTAQYPDIAIKNDGTPIIAYLNQSAFDLALYLCDDEDCTSGSTIDVGISNNDGLYPDVEITQEGYPIIAHEYYTGNELYVYECYDVDCENGESHTLTSGTTSAEWNDMEIGFNGSPIIAHYDNGANDVAIFYCENPQCDGGESKVIDFGSPSNLGYGMGMTLRQNGSPVMSFQNESNNPDSLEILLCDNIDCTTYSEKTLDNVNGHIETTDVEIRHDGTPAIIYYDESDDDFRFYDCYDEDCSEGTTRLLESSGRMGDWILDLEIFPDGRPAIFAYDSSAGDLEIYHCLDEACSKGRRWSMKSDSKGGYANYEIRHDGSIAIAHAFSTNLYFGVYREAVQGYVITRKGNIAGTACDTNRTIACCS